MIKLSKSWDYAIKAVIFLAESEKELNKIKDIASELGISEWFLRRIIAMLEKWNIISSVQWRAWGIRLAKEASKLSLYDVLEAAWEDLHLTWCTAWERCSKKDSCNSTKAFNSLQKWFSSLLKLHTIDKIISKK